MTKKQKNTVNGMLEKKCILWAENYSKKKYGTTVAGASRAVRPVIVYCFRHLELNMREMSRLTGIARATMYRELSRGEMIVKKTHAGQLLYDEIMSYMRAEGKKNGWRLL